MCTLIHQKYNFIYKNINYGYQGVNENYPQSSATSLNPITRNFQS